MGIVLKCFFFFNLRTLNSSLMMLRYVAKVIREGFVMINKLRADSDYKAHTILTFTSANMLSVFVFYTQ